MLFNNNKNTLQQDIILLGCNEIRILTLLLILLQVNFFKLERKKNNFGFEKMKESLDTHETPAGIYASFLTVSAGASALSPVSHWFSMLLNMSNSKGLRKENPHR